MKNIFYAVYNKQGKMLDMFEREKDARIRHGRVGIVGSYIQKVEVVPIREKKEADPFGTEIL